MRHLFAAVICLAFFLAALPSVLCDDAAGGNGGGIFALHLYVPALPMWPPDKNRVAKDSAIHTTWAKAAAANKQEIFKYYVKRDHAIVKEFEKVTGSSVFQSASQIAKATKPYCYVGEVHYKSLAGQEIAFLILAIKVNEKKNPPATSKRTSAFLVREDKMWKHVINTSKGVGKDVGLVRRAVTKAFREQGPPPTIEKLQSIASKIRKDLQKKKGEK